jgi:hypothetical protein
MEGPGTFFAGESVYFQADTTGQVAEIEEQIRQAFRALAAKPQNDNRLSSIQT